jgi:shikimate dehydrogenase
MTLSTQGVFLPEKIYGIIGQPLGHSLSPLIHNWGFQQLGLSSVYFRWPVHPRQLPEFIAALRTLPISGVSVTIPHKCSIMAYLDEYSENALRAGAVNTLYWRGGALWGDNTDVQGFLKPLQKKLASPQKAMILGAGGAARAVLWGLIGSGVNSVVVTARNSNKAAALAKEFGADWMDWDQRGQWSGDVLINATPLGMAGCDEQANPWPSNVPPRVSVVYDLVYNPLETPFLRLGKAAGLQTIAGLEMFISQAVGQFSLWTGMELDLQELRSLVCSALRNTP